MGFRIFVIIGIVFVSIVSFSYFTRQKPHNKIPASTFEISFKPQAEREITVDTSTKNDAISVKATSLPKFVLKLVEKKFDSFWKVEAAERNNLIDAKVSNTVVNEDLPIKTRIDSTNHTVTVVPKYENKLKPGLYSLSVTVKSSEDEDIVIKQDFTWGGIGNKYG